MSCRTCWWTSPLGVDPAEGDALDRAGVPRLAEPPWLDWMGQVPVELAPWLGTNTRRRTTRPRTA